MINANTSMHVDTWHFSIRTCSYRDRWYLQRKTGPFVPIVAMPIWPLLGDLPAVSYIFFLLFFCFMI